MKRLIDVKWQQFGRKGAVSNLSLNLLYALLWTIFAVMSPAQGEEFYTPWSRNVWKLVIFGIVCVMTVDEIRKQITGNIHNYNWVHSQPACWYIPVEYEDLVLLHKYFRAN